MAPLEPSPVMIAKVEVYRCKSTRLCFEHSLLLEALDIPHDICRENGSFIIRVDEELSAAARRELNAYRWENRARSQPRSPPPLALVRGLTDSLPYVMVLVMVDLLRGLDAFAMDWWSAGRSQAQLITAGEWWRCVTALTLHADLGHLGGNLLFGSLFFVLCRGELGSGLAWLMILAGGTLGNALNAVLQPPQHAAVGASTAVFAALGILSALAWLSKMQTAHRLLARFGPLVAGGVLLAFLGTGGERTDVMAHLLGFVCGLLLGTVAGLLLSRIPRHPDAQRWYARTTLAVLVLCWLVALAW